MDDGTGIVHLAPAFGEDDYRVSRKYDLPVLNPVGEDGKFIDGLWKGMLVFEADSEVIKYLKENDKLFKKKGLFIIILIAGAVVPLYFTMPDLVGILQCLN